MRPDHGKKCVIIVRYVWNIPHQVYVTKDQCLATPAFLLEHVSFKVFGSSALWIFPQKHFFTWHLEQVNTFSISSIFLLSNLEKQSLWWLYDFPQHLHFTCVNSDDLFFPHGHWRYDWDCWTDLNRRVAPRVWEDILVLGPSLQRRTRPVFEQSAQHDQEILCSMRYNLLLSFFTMGSFTE